MSFNIKIRKIAQEKPVLGSPPPYWSKVKENLVKVPNLDANIKTLLNSVDKIVFDTSPPKDSPRAIAYVSSADANENSKPDKIHFVLSNMPPTISDEEMAGFIMQIESVLTHEMGHIKDYNPSTGQFPGGESAAESAENSFKPELPSDFKVATEFYKLKKLFSEFSQTNSLKVRK
jgi:hypothetical protein